MNKLTIQVATSDLLLPMEELYRTMGYGSATPEEAICVRCRELMDEACRLAKPSFYLSILDCQIEGDNINVTNESGEVTQFETGHTIASLMRRSEQAAIFVATAGEEFQEWIDQNNTSGEMVDIFIIDSIGSMMVEAAGDYMERQLENFFQSNPATAELKHTNRFSPGYCGWWIEEQKKLFALLPPLVCSIELNDSSLMHPIKSISGIIGVGPNVITKKYGCSICRKTDCYLRRV